MNRVDEVDVVSGKWGCGWPFKESEARTARRPSPGSLARQKLFRAQRCVMSLTRSRPGAPIYGLAVLAEGIETNPANYTKFLSLAPAPAPRIVGAKTSIVFTTQNIPGALYLALGAFATRAINLTKLESRPRREVPWEYVFYVDFEGHQDDPPVAAALLDLSRVTVFLRILGSYPKSPPPLP